MKREFTKEQIRKFFESRLPQERLPQTEGKVRCPFHDDRNPSMSLNMERGVWKCHAGCGDGGILDFEQKFSDCDRATAVARVNDALGITGGLWEKPDAVYQYTDIYGQVLFEKLRYKTATGKRFVQRKSNGRGGFEYKLGGEKKPLYNLPDVLSAHEIVICEGEKDCDNVSKGLDSLRNPPATATGLPLVASVHTPSMGGSLTPFAAALNGKFRLATTTNFDGAGKWREEYSRLCSGKAVVILPDNDEPGRKHAQLVATSVYGYALGVKVVELPGLPEKGDVSDYLQTHTVLELLGEIKKAKHWHPAGAECGMFVSLPMFIKKSPPDLEWLVKGVIQRGANGFFCADPKGGKSWLSCDLAISLATGAPFLDFEVNTPARVALVSREDHPGLTAWRLKQLVAGKVGMANIGNLEDYLYVNTRGETPNLMLDDGAQMSDLVQNLKRLKTEFLILDVFNVLHTADENDNSEMTKILHKVKEVSTEVGCAAGIVHHFSKGKEGASLTQRLRGASAIAGYAEWMMGISVVDEAQKIRKLEFEQKAASPPSPVYYKINSTESYSRIERVPYEETQQGDVHAIIGSRNRGRGQSLTSAGALGRGGAIS